jgi:hypothetical protein
MSNGLFCRAPFSRRPVLLGVFGDFGVLNRMNNSDSLGPKLDIEKIKLFLYGPLLVGEDVVGSICGIWRGIQTSFGRLEAISFPT